MVAVPSKALALACQFPARVSVADAPGYDIVCLSGRGDKDLDEALSRLREIDG